VSSGAPEDNVPETEQQGSQGQGHPAWQEILDVLPDELHPLVTPKLQEWDNGVKAKLQDLNKYSAYEPLVENEVPFEAIQQAMYLAQQFETNPELVVERAIESFGLDKFRQQQQAAQQQATVTPEGEEVEYEDGDNPLAGLENHPAYQQLLQQAQEAYQYEEEAATQLEQYLEELHEEHGEFDDLYVTAMLANGLEAKDAISNFQSLVKAEAEKLAGTSTAQQDPPPVVMGAAGNSGSGLPESNVRLGDLGKGAVADMVAQMIANAENPG
jgi:hypothetical protein